MRVNRVYYGIWLLVCPLASAGESEPPPVIFVVNADAIEDYGYAGQGPHPVYTNLENPLGAGGWNLEISNQTTARIEGMWSPGRLTAASLTHMNHSSCFSQLSVGTHTSVSAYVRGVAGTPFSMTTAFDGGLQVFLDNASAWVRDSIHGTQYIATPGGFLSVQGGETVTGFSQGTAHFPAFPGVTYSHAADADLGSGEGVNITCLICYACGPAQTIVGGLDAMMTVDVHIDQGKPPVSQFITCDRPLPLHQCVFVSTSFDPDNPPKTDGIIHYRWEVDGDTIVDASGPTLSYTFGPGEHVYEISLEVTDDEGMRDRSTSSVAAEIPSPVNFRVHRCDPLIQHYSVKDDSIIYRPGLIIQHSFESSTGNIHDLAGVEIREILSYSDACPLPLPWVGCLPASAVGLTWTLPGIGIWFDPPYAILMDRHGIFQLNGAPALVFPKPGEMYSFGAPVIIHQVYEWKSPSQPEWQRLAEYDIERRVEYYRILNTWHYGLRIAKGSCVGAYRLGPGGPPQPSK